MKLRYVWVAVVVAAAVGWFTGAASTDDKPEVDPTASFGPDQPGAQHEWLQKAVGTWDVRGKFWMDPDQDPMPTTATATFQSEHGDRYLQQEYSSDMMGYRFRGTGVSGYNNITKEFESIWFDNWSTGIMVMRGKRQGDKVVLTGTHHDPTGKVDMREVLTWVDDDTMRMEMFRKTPEGEAKTMELVYKRTSGDAGDANSEDANSEDDDSEDDEDADDTMR